MRASSPIESGDPTRGPCRARSWPVTVVIIALWLGGAAAGLGALAAYSVQGDSSAHAPARWPGGSTIGRTPGSIGVVVFIHPRCPCSAATLSELARVVARGDGGSEVTIAVYRPSSGGPEWDVGPLRARASAIPGVRVVNDIDGAEAVRFGAVCSGHTVAYDSGGALRFQGGITASRGHEGDNLGADCLAAILTGGAPAAERTPTFGCEIVTPEPEAPCPLCQTQEAE